MPLLQALKQEIISEYQVHETDTGSSDVQVALLTNRINQLSQHLQKNPKDFNSRRGLLIMIGKRKRLLDYIAAHSPQRFREITSRLNIRVKK
ncbi:MAG: 30S ribosomal protein S15 [Cyanobacteriota bacterium]|nr:30S ribosomal protein S15 [Cyanobacteriota bacterium]